jgi:hypothetical protein
MQSNVKVLLVDDNPMILAMLRDALAPMARVTTAGDGADALLKAVDELRPADGATTACREWMGVSWWTSCAAGRAHPGLSDSARHQGRNI